MREKHIGKSPREISTRSSDIRFAPSSPHPNPPHTSVDFYRYEFALVSKAVALEPLNTWLFSLSVQLANLEWSSSCSGYMKMWGCSCDGPRLSLISKGRISDGRKIRGMWTASSACHVLACLTQPSLSPRSQQTAQDPRSGGSGPQIFSVDPTPTHPGHGSSPWATYLKLLL